MIDILLSLSFFGFCLSLRRFARWPIEATPFFVISAIIIVFYFSAYSGVLREASILVTAMGGLLFLLSPFYIPKDRKHFLTDYLTPGFVIFIISLIVK